MSFKVRMRRAFFNNPIFLMGSSHLQYPLRPKWTEGMRSRKASLHFQGAQMVAIRWVKDEL